MKKEFTIWDVLAVVLGLLPLVYLACVYDKLPAIVPTHYGVDGKPNNFGPKSEMWAITGLLSGVSVALYMLMKFLPAIDPKKQVKFGEQTFQRLGMVIVIFIAAINLCIIMATIHTEFSFDKVIIALAGLLFIFLGNMMYNIKPNYFAGVRTPWTLEDEGTWRATHRLAGKLWVFGGIIVTVERLVTSTETGAYIFLACLLIMIVIPIVYSYVYFKKHHVKKDI